MKRLFFFSIYPDELFGQVDSKLKSKLEEKKLAHGLKTDRTVNQNGNENDEEQGFTMSM